MQSLDVRFYRQTSKRAAVCIVFSLCVREIQAAESENKICKSAKKLRKKMQKNF